MFDIEEIIKDAISDEQLLCESYSRTKVPHIFEDEHLTFGEIREMFKQIFSGNQRLVEKIDGLNISITNKDGRFVFANNKQLLRDPIDCSRLVSKYDGSSKLKEAFQNTANDLQRALSSIDNETIQKIFCNGKNFLNVDIVYPPAKNIMDYGNKCILQLNSVDIYDDYFNKISEDEDLAKNIYSILKSNNALKQELFEISQPNVLRIKDSVASEKAFQFLLNDLDQLVDGIGYCSTIQDYVHSRLKKYIVNSAMKNGIDVGIASQFVSEMANRISRISHKRPTKTDLVYCAKKDGINPRSENYYNLFSTLANTSDQINEEIMKPIEELIVKASGLLFRNLIGFMAADPNKHTQKLVSQLDETVKSIETEDKRLTKDKIRRFKHHLNILHQYQNENTFPTEGVIFKYTTKDGRSKAYKLIGVFGSINQLMNLIRK